MSVRDKKLSLLHQLSQELEPVSLPELLEKLGQKYSERSIRRWLSEMIQEGMIEKLGKKRASRYKVIRPISRQQGSTSSFFGSESAAIIEKIRRPLYERESVSYSSEWLDIYRPNTDSYLPLPYRNQMHKAGKRLRNEDPAGIYAHQIYNRLLIDLSYNSSRLEGNTYSLLDTQRLLLEGTSAEGKLDEEKIMILNHKEAIRYLVDNAHRLEVNQETICTLHFLLSDGLVEPRYAGKVRDHQVRIGGSVYLSIESTHLLQEHLEKIVKKGALIEDPFEQSFFLLVHLTYLQAFTDVNKRTARLSANIPMIKSNLVPLSFNDIERDDYTSAIIAVYELNEIRPLVDLYVFSYMRTCAVYDSTVKTLGFDEIRVRYRKERREIIRSLIEKKLVGDTLNNFIVQKSKELVKTEDLESFREDIWQDIKEMDVTRIAGLGLTNEQLNIWMQLFKNDLIK